MRGLGTHLGLNTPALARFGPIETLFAQGAPTGADAPDTAGAVAVAMRFDPQKTGGIKSIWFYRSNALASATGAVTIWDQAAGKIVLQQDYAGHSGTGWKEVVLRFPVPVLATRAYIVSYWQPLAGGSVYYRATSAYFNTGTFVSSDGGFVVPQSDGVNTRGSPQRNGLFRYDPQNLMPNGTFNGGNYWVDPAYQSGGFSLPRKVPLPGWPDSGSTGTQGRTLTPVAGDVTLSSAGSTYQDKDVGGRIVVAANNITIQYCKASYGGSTAVVYVNAGVTGTKVYDCELNGHGTSVGCKGIYSPAGIDARRNNIYGCEDGASITGINITFRDNYVHDLAASGNIDPHYDGIEVNGGASNVLIQHNTFLMPVGATSCVNINNVGGDVVTAAVDNNILDGGSYNVYSDGQFTNVPGSTITGVTLTNNIHEDFAFGQLATNANTPSVSGTIQI